MRVAYVALAVLLVCLCQPGSSSEPEDSTTPPRSVVLIISDALRADALGCYGGRAATPNIDRLAANGMLFEHAFSNATWTVPSSACIFTGKHANAYPYEIIIKNDGERYMCRIPEHAVVLWRELAAGGYDLSCYIENGLVAYTGALHGIETILTRGGVGSADVRRIDDLLGDEAYRYKHKYYPVLNHILKMPQDRPFSLVVWFLDPHAPYRPPREEEGDIRTRYSDLADGVGFYRDLTALEIRDMAAEFGDAEVSLLHELYLGEVESVDGRIGNIIMALKHTGRLDDTYLILTSDHGEAFGEHGRFCHGGPEFYTELIHVPLIVAGPGLPKGADISTQVSHIQVIPTIRSLLDLEPNGDLSGRSLVDPAVAVGGQSTPFVLREHVGLVLCGDRWRLEAHGERVRSSPLQPRRRSR